MESFSECMDEYRRQVAKGAIKVAYRGLMEYFMGLKSYLKSKYPGFVVSGSVYFGYMDMTYFAFFPELLKRRGLKVAVVFVHDTFRFEVWLSGYNKGVQAKYWKLIKESGWTKYRIPVTTKGVDSIIEHILVENPDFSNLDELTHRIETGTLNFIEDVENYLNKQSSY